MLAPHGRKWGGLAYDRSMTAITPEEARAYTARWTELEAFQIEELRRTSTETKFLQLCSLMASRDLFAEDPEREEGVREVRERWAQLRLVVHE